MSKIAILFPGQGAQSVGMGKDFYDNFAVARDVFHTIGEDVKKITFSGSQEELNQTINAQPAIFATNLAIAAVLKEVGVIAHGVAGFSLGEISALVYSGVLTLSQGAELVKFRASAMEACTKKHRGGMAAVLNLDAQAVTDICDSVKGAYPANFNSASQTVVSFEEVAYDSIAHAVKTAGGRIMKLAVSGGFHSPLMDDAAEALKSYLDNTTLAQPQLPLYSNYTAKVYESPKEEICKQVNSPVLWQKTIENMINHGYATFIEAGSGKVLGGLMKKINPDIRTYSVFDMASYQQLLKELG